MKKLSYLLVLSLVISVIFGSSVILASEIVDPNIPESWWHAPKPVSDYGITEFNQSPMLEERVASGELPPVADRLPNDPPVIEPYEEIGRYGGTAVTFSNRTALVDDAAAVSNSQLAVLGRALPDATDVVPYLAKDWEYSNDYKTITLYLRKGLKWSDGVPFTADDYMFWWKHVANNSDLTPVPPQEQKPWGLMDVRKIDDYTVSFTYNKPNPSRHLEWHRWCWAGTTYPAHHMKQFHPDFRDKDKLMEEVKEAGFDEWFEYFGYMESVDHPDRDRPSLRPYIIVGRTANTMLYERNPYWPFVDPEGNQLPYIDKLMIKIVQQEEMIPLKMVTGEATLSITKTKASDIPLYKKNQDKGGYKLLNYVNGNGNLVGIYGNLSHPDPNMRKIFQDIRFRKALSYAINRNEINEKLFFGMAKPSQTTALSTSIYYKPEYAEAYVEYKPDKARQLLDEMGMKDVNDDGYRERPDGEPFKVILTDTPRGMRPDVLEIAIANFRDIGINIEIKSVSMSLYWQILESNEWDMSAWQIDRSNDLFIPRAPYQFAPAWAPSNGRQIWPAWVNWYQTNGESGMEPADFVKPAIKAAEELAFSVDPEAREAAGKKLMELQAENLWTIGTVAEAPNPFMVSNKLHNVPEKGFFLHGFGLLGPYYPSQFYLSEE